MKRLPVPRLLIVLLLGVACSPRSKGPEGPAVQTRPHEPSRPIASGEPRPTRAPARLERKHTGQETPTLVVKNQFPIGQHIFLDSKHFGNVASGATATFEVSVGVHTLTSADSADQDDNPVSITESFESGFSYSYEITPE